MSEMRVLLVDDEDELVFTLAERLGMRGFRVDAVTSGAEALEHADHREYDVAVVDVKMPGIGGIQVLRELRLRRPELPVIMLTGHGSAAEGEEGMRWGAEAYLFKPVNIDDLMAAMHDAVGSKGDE